MARASTIEPRPALDAQMKPTDFEAIGAFIIAWNQAEALLDYIVHRALNVQGATLEAIMGSPNVVPRVDIFVAAVRERVTDVSITKAAIKCGNKMKGLSDFRNAVAHGRWAFHTNLKEPSSHRKLSRAEDVTIPKVKAKYADVCALTHQLASIMVRVDAHLSTASPPPWLGKP